jgi:hypothetical protein
MSGVDVERGESGLRITRTWSHVAGYAMLGWTAVWFGLVVFFLLLGRQSPGWQGLLLALPGVGMAYAAATRFANRTLIELNASGISVRHEPLPWPGRKHFARDDIRGLHVETRKIHAKGNIVDPGRAPGRKAHGAAQGSRDD